MMRLRIVSYTVQVNAMTDDGEELVPLAIDPLTVAAKDFPDWIRLGLPASIEIIESQINSQPVVDAQT